MSDSKTNSGDDFRIPSNPVSGRIQKRGSQGYHTQQHNRNQNWNPHPNNGDNRGRGRGGGGWQGRGRGKGGRGGGAGRFNNSDHQKSFRGNDPAKPRPEKQFNFYCCTCDRGFKTQEQQHEHNKEHIICGLEGCTFEGHSLVVTKHIRMQHETNLYQRMKNLQTPEDIDKWKAERRKNYPSAKNVTQKEDEFKEKLERREICDIVQPSKRGRGGGGRGRGGGISARPSMAPCTFRYPIKRHDERSRSFAEYEWKMRKIEHDQSDQWMNHMFAPDIKVRNVRVPFFSMNQSKVVFLENFNMNVTMDKDGKLQKNTKVKWKGFKAKQLDRLSDSESEEDDAEIPISDDEDDMDLHKTSGQKTSNAVQSDEKKQPTKPLGSLTLIDYSSESENELEGDDLSRKDPDQKNTNQMVASGQPSCSNRVSPSTVETAGTENVAASSTKSTSQQDVQSKKTQGAAPFIIEEFTKDSTFKNKPIFSKPHFIRPRKYSRSKLLETLLHDQIRKERNTLLQTCRFIRENNFFDEN